MRKRGRAGMVVSGILIIWLLISASVHLVPHELLRQTDAPLLQGSGIAPSVEKVFDHACINCHSDRTHWPWYGQVAPVSWFVEDDVIRARRHLNLSRWNELDNAEQRMALTAIATVIENREMPPHRYAVFHPEARLSVDESVGVIEWTRKERRRLRASALTAPLR